MPISTHQRLLGLYLRLLIVSQTSPSGNMHGMPLALLMGLSDPKNIPGCEWLADMPKLKPEQVLKKKIAQRIDIIFAVSICWSPGC